MTDNIHTNKDLSPPKNKQVDRVCTTPTRAVPKHITDGRAKVYSERIILVSSKQGIAQSLNYGGILTKAIAVLALRRKSHLLNVPRGIGGLLVLVGNLVLNRVGLEGTLVLGGLEHVPLVLLGVEMLEVEPEGDTTDKGDDSDNDVVPDEERVVGERGEGLADGGGKSGHEEVDTHDEGLHIFGGLGVGVLVGCDVGEDLSETDQDVGETLGPDVDVGGGTLLTVRVLAVGVLATGALLVDVVLHDSGGNHGETRDQETDCHTLDRGEGNAHLAETGVDKVIDDGNHDDNGDGVQVLDDIVGDTVEDHGGGLGGQVTGHLVVGQVEDGEVEEDLAGHETTADFVNPGVIVGHPRRALVNGDLRRLGVVPVEAEESAALADVEEHAQELGQDGSGSRLELVALLVEGQDDGGDQEEDGGDEESEPERVVLLNVDHGNLTEDGSNVDGEVEVEEDSGVGDGGIDNDSLAIALLNSHLGVLILISQEGRYVGLEETSSDTEDDETDDEDTERSILADDNSGG